jgi:hypothetical protein
VDNRAAALGEQQPDLFFKTADAQDAGVDISTFSVGSVFAHQMPLSLAASFAGSKAERLRNISGDRGRRDGCGYGCPQPHVLPGDTGYWVVTSWNVPACASAVGDYPLPIFEAFDDRDPESRRSHRS